VSPVAVDAVVPPGRGDEKMVTPVVTQVACKTPPTVVEAGHPLWRCVRSWWPPWLPYGTQDELMKAKKIRRTERADSSAMSDCILKCRKRG
jgi:hypothetical protein